MLLLFLFPNSSKVKFRLDGILIFPILFLKMKKQYGLGRKTVNKSFSILSLRNRQNYNKTMPIRVLHTLNLYYDTSYISTLRHSYIVYGPEFTIIAITNRDEN